MIQEIKDQYGAFFIMTASFSPFTHIPLLKKIAKTYPEKNILLLGVTHLDTPDWHQLIEISNVHYLGPVWAGNLKNYIASSIGCLTMIDFSVQKKRNAGSGSSLKNMIYLAQKKPIISTLTNDIPQFQNAGLYEAKNETEAMKLVKWMVDDKLYVDHSTIEEELNLLLYSKLITEILNEFSTRNS
jgi:hypothetical protein